MSAIIFLFTLSFAQADNSSARISGTWACQSMSAGAYTGRPCRVEPWLKVLPDGQYEWGREKGKWEYSGGVLSLSERSGKGRLDANEKLVFEYDLHGNHYVLILYQRR